LHCSYDYIKSWKRAAPPTSVSSIRPLFVVGAWVGAVAIGVFLFFVFQGGDNEEVHVDIVVKDSMR
jgi:hypothetical protein